MRQVHAAAFMDYFPFMEDMWRFDTELMRRSGKPELAKYANTPFKDLEDINRILNVVVNTYQSIVDHSKDSVPKEDVKRYVEDCVSKVEKIWGADLTEYNIRTVPAQELLEAIQKEDEELNKHLHEKRYRMRAAPAAVTRPEKNEIIFPDRYSTRIIDPRVLKELVFDTYGDEIREAKGETYYTDWRRPILDSIAVEEITHLLFRQGRGETGQQHIEYLNRCSDDALAFISQHNEIIAQCLGEKILTSTEHAPVVLRERISDVWSNYQRREIYCILRALEPYYPLKKLAMFDSIVVNPERQFPKGIGFMMFDEHPTYQRRLEEVKDIWGQEFLP